MKMYWTVHNPPGIYGTMSNDSYGPFDVVWHGRAAVKSGSKELWEGKMLWGYPWDEWGHPNIAETS
jgi:hypothetical protein